MLQDETKQNKKIAQKGNGQDGVSCETRGHLLLIKIQAQADGSATFRVGARLRSGGPAGPYSRASLIWLDADGSAVADRLVNQLIRKASQGSNAAPLILAPYEPVRGDGKAKAVRWLSIRESQMLLARHQGMTAKEAGTLYNTSHRTVEKQLENAALNLASTGCRRRFYTRYSPRWRASTSCTSRAKEAS